MRLLLAADADPAAKDKARAGPAAYCLPLAAAVSVLPAAPWAECSCLLDPRQTAPWRSPHACRAPAAGVQVGKTPLDLAQQEATRRLLLNPEEAKKAECVVQ